MQYYETRIKLACLPPRLDPNRKPAPTRALPSRMVEAAAIADETRDAPRGVREMTIGIARLGTGRQNRGEGVRRRRNTRVRT